MRNNFIEELFHGNIAPCNDSISKDKDFKKVWDRLSVTEEILSHRLNGENKKLFNEYVKNYDFAFAITPDEIAELGLFKLSKQELKKQQNKIDKQEQAMQVVELAANGMKHQTIADTVGISKRKVQYILKAAGVTREYNRKSA